MKALLAWFKRLPSSLHADTRQRSRKVTGDQLRPLSACFGCGRPRDHTPHPPPRRRIWKDAQQREQLLLSTFAP